MLLERAHVISPDIDLPEASVRVRDGRVAAVGRDLAPEPGEETVDLHGQYLAPVECSLPEYIGARWMFLRMISCVCSFVQVR